MDQALNSQKTPHTSPLRASYGMSFVSILMKNDRVIKGFYCTVVFYKRLHSISMYLVWTVLLGLLVFIEPVLYVVTDGQDIIFFFFSKFKIHPDGLVWVDIGYSVALNAFYSTLQVK